MADPEHLRILKQGVEEWNSWREKNVELRPDLHAADLSAANLQAADLRGANLSAANLSRANLRWADLSAARALCRPRSHAVLRA
jgi:pentapeptide repeat protein